MAQENPLKVLLVEDDEDDFILTRDLFAEMPGGGYTIDWEKSYRAGLEHFTRNQHDICLVDYRLGAENGVDFVRAAIEAGSQAPIILLTGAGAHQVDVAAMQAGADDYLVKGQFRADALERSIRHALQRKRAAAQAAFEQGRLAAFGAEVGLALTRRDHLDRLLERCATAMVQYLNAAAAQISTYNSEKKTFENRAVAGLLAERLRDASPLVTLETVPLAAGKPVFIKHLLKDARLVDKEWAAASALTSFAACPLVLEDKLVGLMSIFTQQPLSEQILREMGSVANGIALCIERKRSEEALDHSENKYRSVVESVKEVIFQVNEFGHWTFLNPAWTAVTGFEVNQTLGTFFLEYIGAEDREHNQQAFLKLIEGRVDFLRYETRVLTRSGKLHWVEAFLQPSRDRLGDIAGASGTLTDITERKQAEVQIQKLAAFPQLNPDPVLEFAADGKLTYLNEAARELMKRLGQSEMLAILPPGAADLARQCLATGQKTLRHEVTVNQRVLAWSFFPIAASQVVHCYGADVTEMQNLEAQLRHAQKLESVGQLAAGVAHDFNNILTVIQGYAESLLAREDTDGPATNALTQITRASQRAASLTRQLLMFSRKQTIQPRTLDLNAVLQNLVKMLGRLVGETITLGHTCAPDLCSVNADVGMIEQVVMNLAVNARDAMPKGGSLEITTANVTIDPAGARCHSDARPGQFACLAVKDTGCGMDRKTLDRIFEPFFTTKEVGKGTGLGLATVYGIVKQHKGWVEVESEPGRGTVFKVFLPSTATQAVPEEQKTAAPASGIGRGETILLVEDEPELREFVSDILRTHHYNVIEAASGPRALEAWDRCNGAVDLLLTDMVMPDGLSGRDLAQQFRSRKPGLKVIYSSGYSPEIMGGECDPREAIFLAKPYHPKALLQLLRQCLNPPAPARPAASKTPDREEPSLVPA